MIKTTYQKPELRDENDNIIQEGSFGKNTVLANSTNDGWIDYVMNNLEALHDVVGETSPTLDANGHVVEPANLAIGDEDGNRIKNSYLKLSGGKVTGIASFRTDLRMLDNQDNRWGGLYVPGTTSSEQYLSLYGGTRATGDARLNLYSVGNGKFELTGYSTDGANTYTLTHDNSGNLKWGSNTVAMLASPAFTGTPTVPTPANNDNSTKVANTAFVNSRLNNYLPLSGGTMTGNIMFGTTGNHYIKTNGNSQVAILSGTGTPDGACLFLNSRDWTSSNAGEFTLRASNKTDWGDTQHNSIDFAGRPDGTLTWGGNDIALAKDVAPAYFKKGNSPSITVPQGTYILIVYVFGYSVPSNSIVYVGLLGGGDYNDGTQHIGVIDILKGSSYASLGLTYSITTNDTKKITVSTTSNNTNIAMIKIQ